MMRRAFGGRRSPPLGYLAPEPLQQQQQPQQQQKPQQQQQQQPYVDNSLDFERPSKQWADGQKVHIGNREILRATYGPVDGPARDVTQQVRQLAASGNNTIFGGIHTVLGDPYPGVPKVFSIWYADKRGHIMHSKHNPLNKELHEQRVGKAKTARGGGEAKKAKKRKLSDSESTSSEESDDDSTTSTSSTSSPSEQSFQPQQFQQENFQQLPPVCGGRMRHGRQMRMPPQMQMPQQFGAPRHTCRQPSPSLQPQQMMMGMMPPPPLFYAFPQMQQQLPLRQRYQNTCVGGVCGGVCNGVGLCVCTGVPRPQASCPCCISLGDCRMMMMPQQQANWMMRQQQFEMPMSQQQQGQQQMRGGRGFISMPPQALAAPPSKQWGDGQKVRFGNKRIVRATYGPQGQEWDVTPLIQQLVHSGQTKVVGGIHTVLGDPCPGVPKIFSIWYADKKGRLSATRHNPLMEQLHRGRGGDDDDASTSSESTSSTSSSSSSGDRRRRR